MTNDATGFGEATTKRQEADLHPDGVVTVVSVQWFGSEAVELTYKTQAGAVANELLYRHDETRLEVVAQGRPWSFDGDGALFRLVSEAQRIRLAHLFDPLLAIHTSVVDPLPHQITGVYDAMLPRQPLRFLLADDPGAGKTIMAGLLIKELVARGDLERCLIVCPGSLAEQWQDELYRRFQLPFEILTNDKLEAARTRNWFLETDLVIARLDKLSRDEDVQQKLQAPDAGWDLVVCDEAHKLSATFFGGEIKYTKRYRLGQLLSGLTRHFLLMTATPHNGKEEDFQLFLALLDGDRFEGRFRDGVHAADVSDLMRRMVKERLLKFDGKPLFPERIAYTVPYRLSEAEARLYTAVTDYVREEFNRAEALANAKRAGTVGGRALVGSPIPRASALRRTSSRRPAGPVDRRLLLRTPFLPAADRRLLPGRSDRSCSRPASPTACQCTFPLSGSSPRCVSLNSRSRCAIVSAIVSRPCIGFTSFVPAFASVILSSCVFSLSRAVTSKTHTATICSRSCTLATSSSRSSGDRRARLPRSALPGSRSMCRSASCAPWVWSTNASSSSLKSAGGRSSATPPAGGGSPGGWASTTRFSTRRASVCAASMSR